LLLGALPQAPPVVPGEAQRVGSTQLKLHIHVLQAAQLLGSGCKHGAVEGTIGVPCC
jgi:hypothetical protein